MRVQLGGFVLVCLCLGAGCDVFGVDGNGHSKSEQRDAADFDSIDSRGSLEIEVEQGEDFAVTVRIDSNLIDKIETRVAGHQLRINNTEPFGKTLSGPHVLITMPQLTAATLSGSGGIAIDGFEQDVDLSLHLSGSGRLDFQGKVPGLSAHLGGSGDIALDGTADHELLDLSGSGTIDARDLHASMATLELSGSGNIRATVDGDVDVALDGSGDIDLFGSYHVGHRSKRGSGAVHEH